MVQQLCSASFFIANDTFFCEHSIFLLVSRTWKIIPSSRANDARNQWHHIWAQITSYPNMSEWKFCSHLLLVWCSTQHLLFILLSRKSVKGDYKFAEWIQILMAINCSVWSNLPHSLRWIYEPQIRLIVKTVKINQCEE